MVANRLPASGNAKQWCSIEHLAGCASCRELVSRRSKHSHHFDKGGREDHILCGECEAIMAVAALPVVKAAYEAGIDCTYAALQQWLRSGNFGILVGQSLDLR